jgi:zinc protease
MTHVHPDYAALVLGNYIFGSGMNSRLFQRVRTKEGLSYGVSSQFVAGMKDDDARFSASASSAPQNAPKVEAVFKEELGKVLAEGYSADEVEAAKKSWLQSRKVGRANDPELAGRLLSHRYWNLTMTSYDASIEEKVAALTPAQIQAAMKRHLDVSKLNIIRAGDFKKANVSWAASATTTP